MTPEELIAFEDEMAAEFEAGNIRAPLHLAGGNEQQLIDIFKNVRANDWVLCSWRSHYHCLLKGVPRDELKAAILAGRSIALCFPKQRVLSSAIVGGIAPIAVGLAWEIKRRGGDERVWCFLGDMSSLAGVVHESTWYAAGHALPIKWVTEDNGLSVCTDTRDAWGHPWQKGGAPVFDVYKYTLTRPHVGTGKWVRF